MCAKTKPATLKASSTWAVLRSAKLSKLRRSVLPSILPAGDVTPEHLFDRSRIEALKDVADGGGRQGTLSRQAEGGIQPAAMHRDEVPMARKGLSPMTTAKTEYSSILVATTGVTTYQNSTFEWGVGAQVSP